jgi:hypothetical protein
MTAPLQKARTTSAESPPMLRAVGDASTLIEFADRRRIEERDVVDYKLRNRIIAANAVAWIVIIMFLRLMFF